jgi:hypothetical protein
MKNSNDTIGNRTRDLPTCSAVFITVKWFTISTRLDYKVTKKDDPSPDPAIPTRCDPFWTTVNTTAPPQHSVRQVSSAHTLAYCQSHCPSSNLSTSSLRCRGFRFPYVCMDTLFPHARYMPRSSYS